MRHTMNGIALTGALLLTACASYPKTSLLPKVDLDSGYRFEQLPKSPRNTPSRNSDELFVILAFSGGGTRAAALSYGVLNQLRLVKFPWDPVTNEPKSCTSLTPAQCAALEQRSLLDEVDVISTVSGGSFTSAYYALNREEIFRPDSRFQRDFLYHQVQGDLMQQAVYNPKNWKRARSRIEIAADYYGKHVFGRATYDSLASLSRPYIILNSTDASTGARFEFTQEQFDLLCADLDAFPVARAVAASSAFPVLLNSMTIDSHNSAKPGCGFKEYPWVGLAINNQFLSYPRFQAARELRAYRDSTRKYLHVLDGGLADNIGLRSVLGSLSSIDRPVDEDADKVGGWNLLTKINEGQVKKVIVITVNAKTNSKKTWDSKRAGPGIVGVVDASAGIPMGNFTAETLELLRQYGFDAELNGGRTLDSACKCPKTDDPSPRFYGVEVSFENIPDLKQREYFDGLGTNFQLPAYAVTCLAYRGAKLLRESSSVTDKNSQPFRDFVQQELFGSMTAPPAPADSACTVADSKKKNGRSNHTVDIGLQYNVKLGGTSDVNDVTKSRHNIGLLVRVAKPNGLGATLGVTRESFVVPGRVGATGLDLGRLTLLGATAGGVLSARVKPVQMNLSLAAGYALAGFRLTDNAREHYAQLGLLGTQTKSSGSFLVRPGAGLWVDVHEKFAATVSASYIIAKPTVRFESSGLIPNQSVRVNALRIAAGIGYRIF